MKTDYAVIYPCEGGMERIEFRSSYQIQATDYLRAYPDIGFGPGRVAAIVEKPSYENLETD